MPFASTTMTKGLIDEDHPLSIGCIERARRQVQRRFLQGCDLVVGLGYDKVEVDYEAWVGSVPVLHVDIEPADVDRKVQLVSEVVGDLDAAMADLSERPPARNDCRVEEIAEHRRGFQAALRPPVEGFAPHQEIDAVRRALPRDGILAFDVGAHTHQIASQWPAHAPRTFQWVVVDGLRTAGSDRRQDRAAGCAGGLPNRRRLLSDDVRKASGRPPPSNGPTVIEAMVDAAHYSETVFD